jgi:hypothetical protein
MRRSLSSPNGQCDFAKNDHCTTEVLSSLSVDTNECLHMILDAGHIGVSSSLADKAEVRQMQSKKGQALTDDDFHKLEGLMYDEFSLKLESTQVRAEFANIPFPATS